MLDAIEHVVYINLARRKDRLAEIIPELQCFGDRVQRFEAIENSFGAIGCSLSHIKVLQNAKAAGWKNVLVIEDDFMWVKDKEPGLARLTDLMSRPYDVIMLTGTSIQMEESSGKLSFSCCSTAYLIADHYYDSLINNLKEGVLGLMQTKFKPLFALDVYWRKLMVKDNWFMVRPVLAVQRPSYSDIENRNVDYSSFFK